MPKYIKAIDVINTLSLFYNFTDDERYELALAISTVPTTDVAEVKHGKWIFSPDHSEGICTICNYKIYGRPYQNTYLIVPYNFCPNCGADMREKMSK